MTFAQPENLYLFGVFAPLVAAWIGYAVWYRRAKRRAGDEPLVEAMAQSVDHRARVVRRVMQLAGIAALIVAAAGPRWGATDTAFEDEAVDIAFALDMSHSMLAEDVRPNRLDAGVETLREVMDRRESDRVGLVVFTSISFIQSPLTTDYSTMEFHLERLHPDQIPVGGTNISTAIQDGVEVLQRRGDENAQSDGEQLIVLLSDGEDHESAPAEAAREAAEQDIRIAAVGIGDPEGAPIPNYDEDGTRRGWIRDDDGERVETFLDEETLDEITSVGDGIHVRLETPEQAADDLVEFLDELEGAAVEQRDAERQTDRSIWFVAAGFVLLILSLFIGRSGSNRRDLPGGPMTVALTAAFVVAILLSGCEPVESTADEVAEAIDAGEYERAVELLDDTADRWDDRPEFHFNQGRALLGLEQHESARRAFARAMSSPDPGLRADAQYHLGLSFAAEESWEEAFDHFRRGLELLARHAPPDTAELESGLTQNLQLAHRELFPPCSEFADEFAPNFSPEDAALLEEQSLEDLTLCGGEDDYFAFRAAEGATLRVEAEFRPLREPPDSDAVFLPDAEQLQLEVIGDDGERRLAEASVEMEDADLEEVNDERRAYRRVERFEFDAEMLDGETEASVFIAARAAEGLEFSYELDIDYDAPCEALDDEFEPNSTADDAADLPVGDHALYLCENDEDWFRLHPDRGDSVFVDIQPETDWLHDTEPELEFELIEERSGDVVGVGQQDGALITGGISEVDFGGDLLVRIRGIDEAEHGPYNAQIHHFEPCPDGVDRYAPNDAPGQASELDPEQPQHRYLRLCPGEQDYHRVELEEDEPLQWSLGAVPENAWSDAPELEQTETPFGRFPVMQLDLVDSTSMEVHASADIDAEPPADDDEQRPPALTDDQLLAIDDPPERPALLRVDGEEGFYHLRREDGGGGGDGGDDEPSDDDHSDDDSEADDDSETDDDQGDRDDHGDDQSQPSQPPQQRELSEDELDQLFRALERDEDNIQLQRAIEEAPTRDVEQEW